MGKLSVSRYPLPLGVRFPIRPVGCQAGRQVPWILEAPGFLEVLHKVGLMSCPNFVSGGPAGADELFTHSVCSLNCFGDAGLLLILLRVQLKPGTPAAGLSEGALPLCSLSHRIHLEGTPAVG